MIRTWCQSFTVNLNLKWIISHSWLTLKGTLTWLSPHLASMLMKLGVLNPHHLLKKLKSQVLMVCPTHFQVMEDLKLAVQPSVVNQEPWSPQPTQSNKFRVWIWPMKLQRILGFTAGAQNMALYHFLTRAAGWARCKSPKLRPGTSRQALSATTYFIQALSPSLNLRFQRCESVTQFCKKNQPIRQL